MRTLALVFAFASFNSHALVVKSTTTTPGYIQVVVSPEAGATDMLFVIDNSGSMTEHQQNLASQTPALVNRIAMKSGSSVNAAVISVDMDGNYGNSAAMGEFAGSPGVLNSGIANFGSILANRVLLGTNGSGKEMHFDAIKAALSEPLLSGKNAGFLRESAHLSVILLTDAEDQSTVGASEVAGHLKNLKGTAGVSTFAIMAPSTVTDGDCHKDDTNQPAVRIEEFLQLTGGSAFNICSPNWMPATQAIAEKIAVSINRTVRLPTEPVLSTVEVMHGDTKIVGGDVQGGWIYDAKTTSIVIGEAFDFAKEGSKELVIKFVPKYWQ